MNTYQFDDLCRRRNEIEMIRNALKFIDWCHAPADSKVGIPTYMIDSYRMALSTCIETYCKETIEIKLIEILEQKEREFNVISNNPNGIILN